MIPETSGINPVNAIDLLNFQTKSKIKGSAPLMIYDLLSFGFYSPPLYTVLLFIYR